MPDGDQNTKLATEKSHLRLDAVQSARWLLLLAAEALNQGGMP